MLKAPRRVDEASPLRAKLCDLIWHSTSALKRLPSLHLGLKASRNPLSLLRLPKTATTMIAETYNTIASVSDEALQVGNTIFIQQELRAKSPGRVLLDLSVSLVVASVS